MVSLERERGEADSEAQDRKLGRPTCRGTCSAGTQPEGPAIPEGAGICTPHNRLSQTALLKSNTTCSVRIRVHCCVHVCFPCTCVHGFRIPLKEEMEQTKMQDMQLSGESGGLVPCSGEVMSLWNPACLLPYLLFSTCARMCLHVCSIVCMCTSYPTTSSVSTALAYRQHDTSTLRPLASWYHKIYEARS